MANPKVTNQERGRREDPDYSTVVPEKHNPNSAGGDTKWGNKINGSYKQPWVEHDPVTPEDTHLG